MGLFAGWRAGVGTEPWMMKIAFGSRWARVRHHRWERSKLLEKETGKIKEMN
jgi:hypothetical protein